MRPLRIFILAFPALLLVSLAFPQRAFSGIWHSYPKDGKFKQLPLKADMWFYVDEERWAIRAPDKWQHLSGYYLSQKILQKKTGKLKALLISETLGVLMEVSDGYYEGWSARDLIADNLGIMGALLSSDKIKFIGSYDDEKVSFSVHFIIR